MICILQKQVNSSAMDATFKEVTGYESYILRILMKEHNGDNTLIGQTLESWIHNVTSLQDYCTCENECFSDTRAKLENFLSQITFVLKG